MSAAAGAAGTASRRGEEPYPDRGGTDSVVAAVDGTASRRRLKYLASINDDALAEDTDPDFEMEYIDIGNVDSSGRISELASYRFEDAPSRARRRVRDGDVIISTVRTYLQAITQIQEPPENLVASTGFAVVRPRQDLFDARYCRFALREPTFLAEVEKRSVGVSYPAINATDLADIPIFVHPLKTQRAIADYLDRETARLDALVAAKERLLKLLAEKRRAIITRAVTCGLDPRAPMRDSGVPWLGGAGIAFPTKRLKHVVTLRRLRTANNPLDDGVRPYVGLEDIESGTGRLLNLLNGARTSGPSGPSETSETDGKGLGTDFNLGDVLFGKLRPYLAKAWVAEFPGRCTTEALVMKATSIEPRFLRSVCLSSWFVGGVNASTFGAKMPRAEWAFIGNMPVPVPEPKIQKVIADYLDHETTQLDVFTAKTRETIDLLKERRAALIAAAVTGRLDLRRAS